MGWITFILFICAFTLNKEVYSQNLNRRLEKFEEVFAWKQLTYNINGYMVLQDRFGEDFEARKRRQADSVFFNNEDEQENNWNQQSSRNISPQSDRLNRRQNNRNFNRPSQNRRTTTTARPDPSSESGRFFIQYNNVPMGVERVGDRIFITVPRRRYGIPSTLNYLDLNQDTKTRSPSLRPYPDLRQSRDLTSVYRTRADECGRLWMVDTGRLEIPDNHQQVQPPAIVIYDLNTNRQILRYPFKASDIPAANTPTGLASITVDIINGDCSGAYAYVPDLTTYGLIVYSLRDNDSWRFSHNYFSFNPTAGNLNIALQRFQWSDGIFSITLTPALSNGCRTAYFHPLISTQEFSVSTCILKNRTANADSNYWAQYSIVGDRGDGSQASMHGYHSGTNVIFFADIGRDAISCWNSGESLSPSNIGMLAQHSQRLSYPSDLHVTDDEVWVMANSLPRFGYSRLDPNEYNFYVYRGNVRDLISGTVCENR